MSRNRNSTTTLYLKLALSAFIPFSLVVLSPNLLEALEVNAREASSATQVKVSTVASDQFDSVRSLIKKRIVDEQIPSVAIAVARDGKILWEEGFGWADRENRIPATEHTMYSLASVSKPLTATGLMVLAERGKIELDRPINDYLGEAKLKTRIGDPAKLTVRRVANHSAGLPLHYQFFYQDEPHRTPSMDETILRYGNVVTPPGEAFEYSNLGYGLLDYLISRISTKSYADFMREEVFLPLGMTHTSVNIGPGLEKHCAVRYGDDRLPIPFYDFDHRGASAIYGSAHDLVKFGMFHLKAHLPDQKAILNDAAIETMQEPTINIGKESGYGIGWGIFKRKSGHKVVWHTGGMGGVATALRLIPSEKIAIVALTNSSSTVVFQVTEAITAILLGESPGASPQVNKPSDSPQFKPPAQLVGLWEGIVHTHVQDLPFVLRIDESGDIHARLGDQLWTVVNQPVFTNETLTGQMSGDIGAEDANRRPYSLHLKLKLRGNTLNGTVAALSLPGKRVGNALSNWAELKR